MLLITGGLGYLGGRVAKNLLMQGKQVRIGTSRDEFILPPELDCCDVVKIDLLNSESLYDACADVTSIIHLAAMNAQNCEKNPEQALLINGLGTLNLLKAAGTQCVKNFIYFSTVHVYGAPLIGDIDETTLPCPTHPYSITHRLAEDYVIECCQNKKMNGTVFRLTNAVGSPLTKNANCWMLAVNDLAKQVVTEHVMTIRSSRSVNRDYLPISGVCKAVDYVLDNSLEKDCELYNLGGGQSTSLGELAEIIAHRSEIVLGIKPEIHFLSKDDPSVQTPDLSISIEKIVKAGFHFDNSIESEIDQLLLNCNKWFA